MDDLLSGPGVLSGFTLGGVAALMGVVGLLCLRSFRDRRPSLVTVVVAAAFALWAASAVLADLPEFYWQPALVLAFVWLVIALCRSSLIETLGHTSLRLLGHPRLHEAALVLGGL